MRLEDGSWLRQLGRIEQPMLKGRLVPRFEFDQERRRQRVGGADSLASPSIAFVEYRPQLNSKTWESGAKMSLDQAVTLALKTRSLGQELT